MLTHQQKPSTPSFELPWWQHLECVVTYHSAAERINCPWVTSREKTSRSVHLVPSGFHFTYLLPLLVSICILSPPSTVTASGTASLSPVISSRESLSLRVILGT